MAKELRHQIDHPLWRVACDAVLWLSSAALGFTFGIALGNVVRGVPIGADGYFRLPLLHVLNWYALLVGTFGFAVLVLGLLAAWSLGYPLLGFLQGAGANWLLASLVLRRRRGSTRDHVKTRWRVSDPSQKLLSHVIFIQLHFYFIHQKYYFLYFKKIFTF